MVKCYDHLEAIKDVHDPRLGLPLSFHFQSHPGVVAHAFLIRWSIIQLVKIRFGVLGPLFGNPLTVELYIHLLYIYSVTLVIGLTHTVLSDFKHF